MFVLRFFFVLLMWTQTPSEAGHGYPDAGELLLSPTAKLAAENANAQLRARLVEFCADASMDCASWAALGECTANAEFMTRSCRKACGACEASAFDLQNYGELALLAVRNAQLALRGDETQSAAKLDRHEQILEAAGAGLLEVLPDVATAVDEALGSLPSASSAPIPRKSDGSAAAHNASSTFVQLADGHRMPALGFGTWMLTGEAAYDAVRLALDAGFRHIDTSENYGNEEEVGRALRDSGLPRAELFVASKLSFPASYGEGARRALQGSLARLGLDYLDLYMLHGAHAQPKVTARTWALLESALAEGLVRSLGVSNFGKRQLLELEAYSPNIRPSVVQNKHSVYRPFGSANYDGDDMRSELRSRRLVLTAYCPLNAWPALASPLQDAHVRALAFARGVTPAQLLLRWAVQSGGSALTRTTNAVHAAENFAIFAFELSAAEMATLDALHRLTHAPWNRLPRPTSAAEPGKEEL